ncbi:hypothetical protein SK128_024923, partial [Halocaridina rubra]
MSSNLQNNPFAALFSSVKDAETFMKESQPEEASHDARAENEDVDATVILLEKLLLITTRSVAHSAPRILLEDGGPMNEESFKLLLFDRLLLDSPESHVVGNSKEGRAKTCRREVVVYLSEVYWRCRSERDNPQSHIIQQVQLAVIDNLTTALAQPELYGGQDPNDQLLGIIRKGLGQDGAVDDLVHQLLNHLADQQLPPPDAFGKLVSDITRQISQLSLMTFNFQLVDILDFYASLPLLATYLTKLPKEISQDRTGRGYHHTPLGSLLAVSCLPRNFGQPNEFFEKPSSKLNQAHKDTENSIWLAQHNISGRIYKLFYSLLK